MQAVVPHRSALSKLYAQAFGEHMPELTSERARALLTEYGADVPLDQLADVLELTELPDTSMLRRVATTAGLIELAD